MLMKVYKFSKHEPCDRWVAFGIAIAVIACLISGVYIRFLRRRAFWIVLGILLASIPIRDNPNKLIHRTSA